MIKVTNKNPQTGNSGSPRGFPESHPAKLSPLVGVLQVKPNDRLYTETVHLSAPMKDSKCVLIWKGESHENRNFRHGLLQLHQAGNAD